MVVCDVLIKDTYTEVNLKTVDFIVYTKELELVRDDIDQQLN